jgi:hypothetical protein
MKLNSPSSPSLALASILAVALAIGTGCSTKPDDARITRETQDNFSQDSGLSSKQLTVRSAAGVVSLSGNVDNDAQREAASRQAASVAGVKTVVNNLRVIDEPGSTATSLSAPKPAPSTQAAATPPPDMTKSPAARPAEKKKSTAPRKTSPPNTADSAADATPAAADSQSDSPSVPDSDQVAESTPPPPPPADTPPPAPSPRRLIIDQGTSLAVRLIDPIDSENNQTGDTFRATLNAALTSDGEQAIPAGVEATGHIVELKSASKFAGQSLVVLQLDSISSGGKTYSLHSDQYRKEGSSQGKSTAKKVGAGAVLGGIIGAVAGGGKGAAIGAAAGAGAGGGVQAASKSHQIKLPSETILNFTLQDPVEVVPASSPDANRPKVNDPQ